jgi:hypothetical protein
MKFKHLRESMTETIPWTHPAGSNEFTFYYEYGLDEDIVKVLFGDDRRIEDCMEVVFSVNGNYYPQFKEKEAKIPLTKMFATLIEIILFHSKRYKQEAYSISPSSPKLRMIYHKIISRHLPKDWDVTGFEGMIVIFKKESK